LRTAVPALIEPSVFRLHLRRFHALQEFTHSTHDVGMRVEGATRETDIGGAVIAETLHQLVTAADHPHRQATAECLAVSDHVGAYAEVLLRAARSQAEAYEDLVEN